MRINKKRLRSQLHKSNRHGFSPTFKAQLRAELRERSAADDKYWAKRSKSSNQTQKNKIYPAQSSTDESLDYTEYELTLDDEELDMSGLKTLPKYHAIELSPEDRDRCCKLIIYKLTDALEYGPIYKFLELLGSIPMIQDKVADRFMSAGQIREINDFDASEGNQKAQRILQNISHFNDGVEVDTKTYQPVTKTEEKQIYDKVCAYMKVTKSLTFDDLIGMSQLTPTVVNSFKLSKATKARVDHQQKRYDSIIISNITKLLHRATKFPYRTHSGKKASAMDYTAVCTYIENLTYIDPWYCDEHISTVNTASDGLNKDGRYDGFYDSQNQLFCKLLNSSVNKRLHIDDITDCTDFDEESIYDIDAYDDNIKECKRDERPDAPEYVSTLGEPEIQALRKLKKRAIKEINYLNHNYYANQFIDSKTHEPITKSMMKHILDTTKHAIKVNHINKSGVSDVNDIVSYVADQYSGLGF